MSYTYRQFTIPDYMMEGIVHYRDKGLPTGDFLRAVFENDFSQVVGRADRINVQNLPAYAAFCYNEMPWNSWGSPERVAAWIKRGGLEGMKAAAEAEKEGP